MLNNYSNERQPPNSKPKRERKNVSFDILAAPASDAPTIRKLAAAAASDAPTIRKHVSRSKSEGPVLNLKASRARDAFIKHNNDREIGGRVKLAEGHIIEARNVDALQFFSTHHDYRRGKIREDYIPTFPKGDELYKNSTLTPGAEFQKAMYDDVVGLYCVNAKNEPVTIEMIGNYREAGVSEQLLINLSKMKITQPLPIQCFLIPFLLNCPDQDIVASAPTGSGKTIAVMLPLIELSIRAKKFECARPPHAPYVIIVGATRDLVHQLCLDSLRLANDTGIKIKCAYGEYQREANARHIREGCDILISTTGRFVDLVDKEDVLVQHARYLAVDEADKLVTDELIQDLKLVLENRIRPDVVHALFSATFNEAVLGILPKLLRNNFIRVELQTESISPTVRQKFYNIEPFDRKEELPYDIKEFMHPEQYRVPKTIIYGEGRRTIDYLAIYLSMKGIRSISMHGGRSQSQRNDAWSGFINGKYQVLCASNVAARGMNFPDVVQIINYDAPIDFDTYVHRIGRAGRLGFKAQAITFLNPTDTQQMILASHIVPALKKLGQKCPLWLKTMANFITFGTQDDINVYL
uniref:RNA helicase n=1 Tax=Panagrolaimus superbus TaxID=310955 RepID=A0A914Y0U7_9BILA